MCERIFCRLPEIWCYDDVVVGDVSCIQRALFKWHCINRTGNGSKVQKWRRRLVIRSDQNPVQKNPWFTICESTKLYNCIFEIKKNEKTCDSPPDGTTTWKSVCDASSPLCTCSSSTYFWIWLISDLMTFWTGQNKTLLGSMPWLWIQLIFGAKSEVICRKTVIHWSDYVMIASSRHTRNKLAVEKPYTQND